MYRRFWRRLWGTILVIAMLAALVIIFAESCQPGLVVTPTPFPSPPPIVTPSPTLAPTPASSPTVAPQPSPTPQPTLVTQPPTDTRGGDA